MALEIIKSGEKVSQIVACVRDYGLLIGEVNDRNYVPGLPCKPGLGMNTMSECFAGLAEDLSEGVFKILVMGKFKNGKSTFINALLGKMMMAARATATTAVIAMVQYGRHEDCVQVYRVGRNQPELISLEDFTKEFALTEDDQVLIEEGGKCDRFADIEYVVMESQADLFRDGVRLIDSPGLEEANARTKTTNEFVPKANAILFMLNASSLFSGAERKYIADNFAGKHQRNVFFIVNRIDNLNPGDLESTVKPAVKAGLTQVFLDENGNFDEELYEKRVFFTNAYGALCARTGEPYKISIGERKIDVQIAIEDTGMPEFEKALSEFLDSDERIIAMFQSTLSSMANTYQDAQTRISADLAARNLPLEQLEKNLVEAGHTIEDLRMQAESMNSLIQRSGKVIGQKVYNSLLAYVQTEIPREFASEVESNDAKFGMGNMLKMAASAITSCLPWADKQEAAREQEKLLEPITDEINKYILAKMEVWETRIGTEIEPELRDLEKELGYQMNKFEVGLNQAVEIFAYGNVKNDNAYTASPLQTAFALSQGDFSLVVEGAAVGGMSWSDYLKHTLVQGVINWSVGMIFGSAILLPALVIEALGLVLSSQRLPGKLLNKIGPLAFENLRERVQNQEQSLREDILNQFTTQGADLLEKANGLVDEAENRQRQIIEEKQEKKDANDTEAGRQSEVLNAMRNRFNQVYETLYGHTPNDLELERFAKRREG